MAHKRDVNWFNIWKRFNMVLNIGINQAQNSTNININFDAAPEMGTTAAQPAEANSAEGLSFANLGQTFEANPAPPPATATAAQGQQQAPQTAAASPAPAPSSAISQKIQALTGHKKGEKANGSKLDQANAILARVMNDPRWQAAEAKKKGEQIAKSGQQAGQWDVLANTALHSTLNAAMLGTNAMGGNINAIQDDAEKVLMTILKDIGGGDANTEKLLLAAVHFKTTNVDLSNKIGEGENKAEKTGDVPSDAVLKDKPKRSEATLKKGGDFMDDMGKMTLIGWNHDFCDGQVDGNLGRDTKDKSIIFKGADPMAHIKETQKALQALDPSATVEDAYDMSYHDIVGNLLSGQPSKLDTKKLVSSRLDKLSEGADEKQKGGMKHHMKKMMDKVHDMAKKNPEAAAAMAGAATGAAATMMAGCPFAGATAGMGAAMGTHNALKKKD
jgi:hypothetical protein